MQFFGETFTFTFQSFNVFSGSFQIAFLFQKLHIFLNLFSFLRCDNNADSQHRYKYCTDNSHCHSICFLFKLFLLQTSYFQFFFTSFIFSGKIRQLRFHLSPGKRIGPHTSTIHINICFILFSKVLITFCHS